MNLDEYHRREKKIQRLFKVFHIILVIFLVVFIPILYAIAFAGNLANDKIDESV